MRGDVFVVLSLQVCDNLLHQLRESNTNPLGDLILDNFFKPTKSQFSHLKNGESGGFGDD